MLRFEFQGYTCLQVIGVFVAGIIEYRQCKTICFSGIKHDIIFVVGIQRPVEYQRPSAIGVTAHGLNVAAGSDQVLDDDCQSYMSSFEGIRGPDKVLGKPVDRDALLRALLEF